MITLLIIAVAMLRLLFDLRYSRFSFIAACRRRLRHALPFSPLLMMLLRRDADMRVTRIDASAA